MVDLNATWGGICLLFVGVKKVKVRRHASYNFKCQVCNYKLEAICAFFCGLEITCKTVFNAHSRSTPVRLKNCEKACVEAIDRRRNPIPSCLIGQHLVLIIEMIRTLGVANRLLLVGCCWQWHTHAHIWAAARPVNLSLIAAAAAHSPHLSNAMINKYLIKFGVSNGEFTKHTQRLLSFSSWLFHPLCLRAWLHPC